MNRLLPVLAALCVGSFSCHKADPLVGVYRPRYEFKPTTEAKKRLKELGVKEAALRSTLETAEKTDMILDLRADHTYFQGAASRTSMHTEGTWAVKDNTLTLTPTKIVEGTTEITQLEELKKPLTARVEGNKLVVGQMGLEMIFEKSAKP